MRQSIHDMPVCADAPIAPLWLAHELKTLADRYYHAEQFGAPLRLFIPGQGGFLGFACPNPGQAAV